MNVLAIEYSSAQRSIAVIRTDASGKILAAGEAIETGGRAANTFRLAKEALQQAGLEREQIEAVAVGLGPGSYTGIRSAISFAQGWQLAAQVKVLGIPSTECLVAEAVSKNLTGKIAAVIDAQRGDVYLACYEIAGAGVKETAPLRIAPISEAKALEASGVLLVGPEAIQGLEGVRLLPATALTLAHLAVSKSSFVSADTLAPVYLRETTFVKAPTPRAIA